MTSFIFRFNFRQTFGRSFASSATTSTTTQSTTTKAPLSTSTTDRSASLMNRFSFSFKDSMEMLKPFIITDDTTAEADNDDVQDTDAAAVDKFGSNVAHAANIPAVTFKKFTALPIAKATQHDDSRVDMSKSIDYRRLRKKPLMTNDKHKLRMNSIFMRFA